MKALIDTLLREKKLSREDWISLFSGWQPEDAVYAAQAARRITEEHFGKKLYFRGIIEFTNYCRNDCYYCGLRRSSKETCRYRLTEDEILDCCRDGYEMGYRTFVLQGGEDPSDTDERICRLVARIKNDFPDTAVTLSIGEREKSSYQAMFDAGADRYLLRHETALKAHYEKLHPKEMSFEHRMECLWNLKEIGFQTGCGMMVGSPYQTAEALAEDMLFMEKFRPHMIGIGPYRRHHATPFRNFPDGSSDWTYFLLSLCRIMLPEVLLPATTALGCEAEDGRKKAILSGANVIMPNLSPRTVRKQYLLYDNKPGLDQDAAGSLSALSEMVSEIGYEMVVGRGDYGESSLRNGKNDRKGERDESQ